MKARLVHFQENICCISKSEQPQSARQSFLQAKMVLLRKAASYARDSSKLPGAFPREHLGSGVRGDTLCVHFPFVRMGKKPVREDEDERNQLFSASWGILKCN